MTKFYFIAALALAVLACTTPSKTNVTVHVEGTNTIGKATIVTPDSTYTSTLDSTLTTTIAIADNTPAGYATLHLGRITFPLYIEPAKDFDVSVKIEGRQITPAFTGQGSPINTFLNGETFHDFRPDYKMDEADFINAMQTSEAELIKTLEAQNFPSDFVQAEKRRIHYMIVGNLMQYISYHPYYAQDRDYKPSDKLYNTIRDAVQQEPELLTLNEYCNVIEAYVHILGARNLDNPYGEEALKAKVDFALHTFTDPAIQEHLVDNLIYGRVSNAGIDNLGNLIDIYNAKVTDPAKKAAFQELCDKWAKIAKGQPSIGFKYLDIKGKEVTLASLAGKYVYIDCWATWCGPCRGELPHLQKLEHKYKGRNIHFVSISCDQDKSAWENMVKKEKLGGIQLHNGGDDTFMDFFMVTGIPRFILLDREGKIIASNAPRPSSPETVKLFDSLQGL